MNLAFAGLVLVLVTLLSVHTILARAFRGRALHIAAGLQAGRTVRPVDEASLPPLVAAFARRAGVPAGQPAASVSFTQEAMLRMKPGGPFAPFRAWQVIATRATGFLWDARRDAGPLVLVRVVDALAAGEGRLEARLLGSVPLAETTGPDVTLGEAYRYLAELPWAPDAILGNPDLAWHAAGENRVEVALAMPAGEARVAFLFDASGDIVGMEAKGRPARDAAGAVVRHDWRGTFGDYTRFGPRRVPATGEIGYVYPSGYEVYFRGRITDYRLGE